MGYDVIVGLGVDPNLFNLLGERVNKIIGIYEKNKAAKIIVSGKHSYKMDKSPRYIESEVMRDELIKGGVALDNIILERESGDTLGNAFFTKNIIDKRGWKDIAVITSDIHIPKAKYYFDMVFAGDYELDYIGSETNLPLDVLEKAKKHLSDNLSMESQAIKKFGGERDIDYFFNNVHPVYSKNSKLTIKEWSKAIGN